MTQRRERHRLKLRVPWLFEAEGEGLSAILLVGLFGLLGFGLIYLVLSR